MLIARGTAFAESVMKAAIRSGVLDSREASESSRMSFLLTRGSSRWFCVERIAIQLDSQGIDLQPGAEGTPSSLGDVNFLTGWRKSDCRDKYVIQAFTGEFQGVVAVLIGTCRKNMAGGNNHRGLADQSPGFVLDRTPDAYSL